MVIAYIKKKCLEIRKHKLHITIPVQPLQYTHIVCIYIFHGPGFKIFANFIKTVFLCYNCMMYIFLFYTATFTIVVSKQLM